MNAEQLHNPWPGKHPAATTEQLGAGHALSALADGELGEAELVAMLAAIESPAEVFSSWHAYQVVGAVLRGDEAPVARQPPSEFLAAVRTGLGNRDGETFVASPKPLTTVASAMGRRTEAANDALFRWKLVAGLASIAAVMAVSWTVVGGSGAGAGPDGAPGSQLASAAPPSTILQASGASVSSGATSFSTAPVVVSTGQGPLIRDAQLEALLAEHRQHGGMSALQMPTGFIRNATYEAAGR